MAQHAGPLRRSADEGQRAKETQGQGEEQQEAQLRIVGPDNGGGSVIGEYEEHGAGAERANKGDGHQGDAHSVAKGHELHLFGDTGCPLRIGPELWQAAHTLDGL